MMRVMTVKRSFLALLGAGLLVVGASACGGDDDDGGGSETTTVDTTTTEDGGSSGTTTAETNASEGGGGAVAVTIEGFAYDVQPVTAGQPFDVENKDTTNHTFTADDGAFDVQVSAGSTESVDGLDAGTYAFHCTIHPSMMGTLEVA